MNHSPIPIIVVDDHQIVIDGIRALLILNKDIKIIGTANNAEQLWELLETHTPQVILLDRELPTMDGIDVIQKLVAEEYPLRVLMLTADTDKGTILRAVQAGAYGFLPKECSKEELVTAIEQVAKGEHYFGKTIAPIVYQSFAQQMSGNRKQSQSKLTNREIEVIRGFANGQTYKEIGATLFISPRTVETHKKNIYDKLGFKHQADLIKYAIREGIVTL